MHPTTQQFIQFARDLRHNAWFNNKDADIYCRVSYHGIDSGGTRSVVKTFDLANIVIHPAGQGLFTEILDALEAEDLELPILYVENVIEERFQQFFAKRGYTRQVDRNSSVWPPSYWKPFAWVQAQVVPA